MCHGIWDAELGCPQPCSGQKGSSHSKRTQEVQQVLLICGGVVVADNFARFRASVLLISTAGMGSNKLHEVGGPAVVEEEDSLAQSHCGAVRNSSPPVTPWVMLSARFGPMW